MRGYLRIAGRLSCSTLRSTRHVPQPSIHASIRHFSAVLQRPQPHILKPYLATIQNSRNFWGSSSTPGKSPSLQPPTIPANSNHLATPDPQTSVSTEDILSTSATAPEPTWADTSEPLTSGSIPELSSSVDALPSSVTDIITQNTVPPLQYGNLADLGLAGWTPAGLIRWSFELIQVSTGMPWFWTIVVGTAFWRIVVLPLTLKGTQNTARVIRHGPALEAAKTRLNAAIKEGNVAYKTAAVQGLSDTYAKARITPSSMVLVPLAQLPIAFGLFLGIKKMCEFPVEQLKYSGIDLLPDLTAITSVADPYYIMPILATVALNIQMMLAARDTDPKKGQTLHILNAFRALSPLMALFMAYLPVGLVVSIITSTGMSVVTTFIAQLAVARRMMNIPPLPAQPPRLPTLMESRAALYKFLEEKQKAAEAQAQVKTRKR